MKCWQVAVASACIFSGASFFVPAYASQEDEAYIQELETYRQHRLERLVSDDYYLTLAGLFWLQEGDNSFGCDPSNTIVLPKGAGAALLGMIRLEKGETTLRTVNGIQAMVNDKLVKQATLTPNSNEPAKIVSFGDVSFWVIQRGEHFLVRMRDLNSSVRLDFTGVDFYPPSTQNKVVARYELYETPKKLLIVNVIGTIDTALAPGVLVFEWNGQECRLDPQLDTADDEEFFIVFGDETNGSETYGSGRFLVCKRPENGKTTLDFNKAYNPPCAFSPFTTCPLPPTQNLLPVIIQAGEKVYKGKPHGTDLE